MDLKIKDVAELLHHSESTIRRWLAEGKIPGYLINNQYRFSRIEIEDWVIKHKLKKNQGTSLFEPHENQQENTPPSNKGGNKQFSLYRSIHKGGVYHDIPGNTKEEVIRNTMKTIAKNLNLDADVVTDLLLDREELMPTALNNGIGVPHMRDSLSQAHQDIVVIVFPKNDLNYGALDGKPVHTLFFLFASGDKRHLHLLAKIAHLSSKEETLELLKSRPEKKKLLEFIKDWESIIQDVVD